MQFQIEGGNEKKKKVSGKGSEYRSTLEPHDDGLGRIESRTGDGIRALV